MPSGSSDWDELFKLFQMGTMAGYHIEFEILINRVMGISENLLKSFYISGLKPALQCALLRSIPTTFGKAFSLARITEARFEDQQTSSFSNKTSSNNSGLQNQNLTTSRFTMSRQEPVDEAVFVKVNDETKGFSLAKSIEENNVFDATSSDQPAAGLEANKVVNGGDGEVKVLNWVQEAIDVESTFDNNSRDQASELETKVLVDGKQDDAKVVKVVGVADEQISDAQNVLEGNGVIGVGVNENNKRVDKEVQYFAYTLHVRDFEGVRNDTPVDMHRDFVMGWNNHHTYQSFRICVYDKYLLCFKVQDPEQTTQERGDEPNHILLVTIHHMLYPITVEVIHQVYSRREYVEKVVTFQKSAGF
ncbi:hypothetical protein Tco_0826302 [Tanacetum coccineum]